MQERGYPGISAKTIELYAGDGLNFVKVAAFAIGKEERKEYPLPQGTAARQVKVVVTGNHGHKDFTEIAEIELFGARAGTTPAPQVAGDFKTQYGPMRFVVEGDEVYGCYDYKDGGDIFGSLAGRNARVTWVEFMSGKARQGNATFAVTADGAALFGVWYENGQLKGTWEGPRTTRDKGAKCTPRKKDGQFETLKKSGRLVLYGIRFDSNSDVPRQESAATIDAVAGFMKQEVTLRLLIEGHTDATNTDAYNLDLSQRRAQAVVAALVKRGVDAARLKPQGFGRTKPVADNESAQGRALNRRVEVSLLE
jgi:outer membrane protein OmpA-like peptidoglycan-associated protein